MSGRIRIGITAYNRSKTSNPNDELLHDLDILFLSVTDTGFIERLLDIMRSVENGKYRNDKNKRNDTGTGRLKEDLDGLMAYSICYEVANRGTEYTLLECMLFRLKQGDYDIYDTPPINHPPYISDENLFIYDN